MWWQPSKSNDIKPIPWLAPKVIQHLENLIQPDWEIIEHGSGGSTLWFAERCKSITSFEDNPDWQKRVKERAPQNVTIYNSTTTIELPYGDLLLIDGEPVEDRVQWIESAPDIVKLGGWIVLDNANRPEYAEERKHLQEIAESFETFDGNEAGTLYLVTEFYRMPK